MITDTYLKGKGFTTKDGVTFTHDVDKKTYDIVAKAFYLLNGYPIIPINESEQLDVMLKDNGSCCSWKMKGPFLFPGADLDENGLKELFDWLGI